MVPLDILRIALVSALLFTSVSGHCTTPKVRKEWRRLSPDERASWINAVKVFLPLPEQRRSFLNLANVVHCQVTARSQDYPHRRPGDFVDPIYNPEQFLLRWWDGISNLDSPSADIVEQTLYTLTWTSTCW